jgi:periplasmic protein TonB
MKNLVRIVIAVLICFSANCSIAQNVIINDSSIFAMVSVMPSFGENKEDLQVYIQEHSKFPTSLNKTETSRNVFVRLIIEASGKAVVERILRSPSQELSAEARRIIEEMPLWKPGYMEKGKPVRVYYSLPFWFK